MKKIDKAKNEANRSVPVCTSAARGGARPGTLLDCRPSPLSCPIEWLAGGQTRPRLVPSTASPHRSGQIVVEHRTHTHTHTRHRQQKREADRDSCSLSSFVSSFLALSLSLSLSLFLAAGTSNEHSERPEAARLRCQHRIVRTVEPVDVPALRPEGTSRA